MKKRRYDIWRFLRQIPLVLFLVIALVACGDDDDVNGTPTPTPPSGSIGEAPPETARTVTGTIDTGQDSAVQSLAFSPGATLTLDNDQPVTVDDQGRFEIREIEDGNHSLCLHHPDGKTTEIPFRMTEGRSLSLGTDTVRDGQFQNHTGFNGYRFGFIDENNDGINDLFVDDDGDGICDNAGLYAGYPNLMGHGWADANGNGINDRFRDSDGDGINDLDNRGPGPGFGFVDENSDGINDVNDMPFRHSFGFVDEDGDGINDRFVDADGDGLNDRNQVRYIAMPGWGDLEDNGINDFFQDSNGDGLNDLDGMPYGHGFGWVDEDNDGVNDRFVDSDGDGVCDLTQGPFAEQPFFYGYTRQHRDANGDGVDDDTAFSYHHGFGWVDADGDGINDAFADANGDGVNDFTGHFYDHRGFRIDTARWNLKESAGKIPARRTKSHTRPSHPGEKAHIFKAR